MNFNTYSTPVLIIVTFIVVFANFRETEPPLQALALPVYNAALVLKELFRGEFNGTHFWTTLATLALYAAISLWLAVQVFKNEKVLFRQ